MDLLPEAHSNPGLPASCRPTRLTEAQHARSSPQQSSHTPLPSSCICAAKHRKDGPAVQKDELLQATVAKVTTSNSDIINRPWAKEPGWRRNRLERELKSIHLQQTIRTGRTRLCDVPEMQFRTKGMKPPSSLRSARRPSDKFMPSCGCVFGKTAGPVWLLPEGPPSALCEGISPNGSQEETVKSI